MATDYDDERRRLDDASLEDSLEELQARQIDKSDGLAGLGEVDETAAVQGFALPGADLSDLQGQELTVEVLPRQGDEFTCTHCFLVRHRSQAVIVQSVGGGDLVCNECAP